MDDTNYQWKIANAAWDAALSLVDDKGDLTEDFDVSLKKFTKRKSCRSASTEYCAVKLKNAIRVAQVSIRFMRAKAGTMPPKPVRRYELLLALAKELETKCPEASASLQMAGCRYVELHWDR
jgi:hypothetical protein